MKHISFNPGPSQVTDETKKDLKDAVDNNLASISHRSDRFVSITQDAIKGLRSYFKVPEDYTIILTSSATEALELAVRNLVIKESYHFTNGHFSELFAQVSKSFGYKIEVDSVEWGEKNNFVKAQIPSSAEIVTVTYNETSTGVSCNSQDILRLKKRLNDQLLIVDITSAAGCIPLNFSSADVWLFSVQKGLGLPSGLGVMFISPQALSKAKTKKTIGLFSFEEMADKMLKFQTIHTPNVLGIYLLAQQLKRWNKLSKDQNYKDIKLKAEHLDRFIKRHVEVKYFVQNPDSRSISTITLAADSGVIKKLDIVAINAGLTLGKGYGKLKDTTIRIANFPAISINDMDFLINTLESTPL